MSPHRPKSSDNLSTSTPPATYSSAASPWRNSLHRLDPNQSPRPRPSNPHSGCGTAHVPLSAVSPLGGFWRPAAEYVAPALKRPASETLHKLGSRTYKSRQRKSRPKAAFKPKSDVTDYRRTPTRLTPPFKLPPAL